MCEEKTAEIEKLFKMCSEKAEMINWYQKNNVVKSDQIQFNWN